MVSFQPPELGLSTSVMRLVPSLHRTSSVKLRGHGSRGGNPAASTNVGKTSTNSVSLLDLHPGITKMNFE